jgi:hypothetical protein
MWCSECTNPVHRCFINPEGLSYGDLQEGCVNVYIVLCCILQGSGVSPPWFLTPQGLENNRALLCTLASTHIPVVVLVPEEEG